MSLRYKVGASFSNGIYVYNKLKIQIISCMIIEFNVLRFNIHFTVKLIEETWNPLI